VKRRGDTVGDDLTIRVDEGEVEIETDAGARHDLTLECIAMNIDDTGENDEAGRIQGSATHGRFGEDAILDRRWRVRETL
jgi:hypothetical protein